MSDKTKKKRVASDEGEDPMWEQIVYMDVTSPSSTAMVLVNNNPNDFHRLCMESIMLKDEIQRLRDQVEEKDILVKSLKDKLEGKVKRKPAFDYKAICEDVLNQDQLKMVDRRIRNKEAHFHGAGYSWSRETLTKAQELRTIFGSKGYVALMDKMRIPLPSLRSMCQAKFFMPPGKGYFTKHPDMAKFKAEQLAAKRKAVEQMAASQVVIKEDRDVEKIKEKLGHVKPLENVDQRKMFENLQQILDEPDTDDEEEEYRILLYQSKKENSNESSSVDRSQTIAIANAENNVDCDPENEEDEHVTLSVKEHQNPRKTFQRNPCLPKRC